jgi:hypothetical protein
MKSASLKRKCTCGHVFGAHSATFPHRCLCPPYLSVVPCSCESFREPDHLATLREGLKKSLAEIGTGGVIYIGYRVICGKCQTDYATSRNSRAEAISDLRASGWRNLKSHGWTGPCCLKKRTDG